MTEAPRPRAQMHEILKNEPVIIVPVTEKDLPRFEATLTQLGQASQAEGMLPMTGNAQETNEEWLKGTKELWLIGQKKMDFADPTNVEGFVNVYAPEHNGSINEWLLSRNMHAYDHDALMEVSSYVKDGPQSGDVELSASKQALAKVFTDANFRDVRAVTTWVTHTPENTLDPKDAADVKKLGGWPLGSLKYGANEPVDSTCFLITRRAFLDAMTGIKRP